MSRQDAHAFERSGHLQRAAAAYEASRPRPGDPPDERYAWANGRALLAERMADVETATALYDEVVALFPLLRAPTDSSIYGLSNAAIWAAGQGEVATARRLAERFRAAATAQQGRGVTYELPLMDASIAAAADDHAAAERHWQEVADAAAASGQQALLPAIAEGRAEHLIAIGRSADAIDLLRNTLPDNGAFDDLHVPAAALLGALLVEEDAGVADGVAVLRHALRAEAARGMPEVEARIFAALAEAAGRRSQPASAILLGKAAIVAVASATSAAADQPSAMAQALTRRLLPHRQLVARLVEATRLPEAGHVQAMMQRETVFDLARRDADVDIRTRTVPLRPDEEPMLAAYADIAARMRAGRPEPGSAEPAATFVAARDALADWFDRVLDDAAWTRRAAPAPIAATGTAVRGVLVLRYMPAGEGWQALAELDGESASFAVPDAASMAGRIFAFRAAMTSPGEAWRLLAESLYDDLLRPVAHLISTAAEIRLTLDGGLAYLPFAALHDGVRPLVARLPISVETGIAPAGAAPPRSQWRLRVFGSEGAAENRLQHVAAEIDGIVAAVPGASHVAPFTVATLAATLAAGAEGAHLAGHFHHEPARPDRSWLALDDGERLTLATLRSGLDFSNIELLALSACDTALAEAGPYGLESFAGLAQAKGARCVLGTLWPVADASAARLMQHFYRVAFADPDLPLAAALRQAQLAIAGETLPQSSTRAGGLGGAGGRAAHPYHWAGYVLHV